MKKLIIILIILITNFANATTLNIYDGYRILLPPHLYDTVNIYNSASLNIIGADIKYLFSYGSSIVNVYNTGILNKSIKDICLLNSEDNSTIYFFEGKINIINLAEHSTFHLYSGKNIKTISYVENDPFQLHIYGKSFSYNYSTKYLQGIFLNDIPFNIFMRSAYPHNNVILHIVPEPSIILLLLMGIAAIRIKLI